MRLFIISLSVLFVVAFSLVIVRFWGSAQTYSPYQHPVADFLSQPRQFIQPQSLDSLHALPADQALFLNLTVSKNAVFGVNFDSKKPSLHEFEDSKWPATAIKFSDLLPQLKNRCVILNIVDNVGGIHTHVQKMLGDHQIKESECFILTSETESVVKATKEILPRYVYGSAKAEIMTMIAMQSMFILPAFKIRSDVLVAPLRNIHGQMILNEGLIEEAHHQFKKVIIGPLQEPTDIEMAQSLKADGVILSR